MWRQQVNTFGQWEHYNLKLKRALKRTSILQNNSTLFALPSGLKGCFLPDLPIRLYGKEVC